MTKTQKIIIGATSLAMFGFAALPMASYADSVAETDVEVIIASECEIGSTGGTIDPANKLGFELSLTTPNDVATNAVGEGIGIVCNGDWILTEEVDNLTLKLRDNGTYSLAPTVGFTSTGVASASVDYADGADNSWAMRYTGTGTGLTALASGVTNWHSLSTTPSMLAEGAQTSDTVITQFFGAKTDGSVDEGSHGGTVTYTLTQQ